jgi:hypothetical protein
VFADVPAEQLARSLDAAAAAILQTAGLVGPPVDATVVARRLGMEIGWDGRQQGRARLVRPAAGGGAILVRPDPRPERLHWAVAHEIGETLAAEIADRLGIDPRTMGNGAREALACAFAGRLLAPTPWLAAAAARPNADLGALKRTFGTASHELLARRLLDLDDPLVVTIFDQGRMTFRRTNVGEGAPPLTAAERRCQRRAHQSSRPAGERRGPQRVDAWPVHDPPWMREIVRWAPAMDAAEAW